MPDARRDFRPDLYRSLGSLTVTLLIMAVLLFGAAGTVDWAAAWRYLALFVVVIAIAIAYLWRVDPELFAVRRRPQAGSKSWDFAYVAVTVAAFALILPVAGLDFRFDWLQAPAPLVWLGYLLFIAGFWITSWAQGVNRHFELTVRIQTDRGHKVIDTGPYAVIRHPGYAGGLALGLGTSLALGSPAAVIPVLICCITLALRTLAEESTLEAELPGYAEYMQRVRFRWIPGLW
jgi:protein-S-isoprenylcysteine O-methyltransferase Ste14